MSKPYERYGPEWEKEMMKWEKPKLIRLLRQAIMDGDRHPNGAPKWSKDGEMLLDDKGNRSIFDDVDQ